MIVFYNHNSKKSINLKVAISYLQRVFSDSIDLNNKFLDIFTKMGPKCSN